MFKTLISASVFSLSLVGFVAAETPMAFDVAEDHTRIHMADAPVHENGYPAHGNAFISQGYIYPVGTLKADTTGVLEDGSPAFPDLVLGTWTCDGYFVGQGANAKTGVWIISRQVFAFEDGDTIITQGTEIVDTGVENTRPITGATGDYAEDRAMVQILLGFSEQMTVNATFRIEDHKMDSAGLDRDASGVFVEDVSLTDYGIIEQNHHLEWDSGAPVGPIEDEGSLPST
jgi:hypothetical protein